MNMISATDREMNIYDGRLCLLCPDGTVDLRDLRGASLDDHRMDHSRTVSWDPGIVDSRTLSVCYDCLCLMTLFRTVIYLAAMSVRHLVWQLSNRSYHGVRRWGVPRITLYFRLP